MRSTSSVQQGWGWSVPRRKLHFTSPALAQPKPKRKKAVKSKDYKGEDLPADFATWSRMRQARELAMRGQRMRAAASKQPQPKNDQEAAKMVEATRSAEDSGEGSVRERGGGEAGGTKPKANADERKGNGDRGQLAEQRELPPGVSVAPQSASSASAGGVQGQGGHCERIDDGQSQAETSASLPLQQTEVVPGPQEVVPDKPPMPAEAQGAGAGLGDEGTAAGPGAALERLASGEALVEAPQMQTEMPLQEPEALEAVGVGALQPSPQVRPETPLQLPEATEVVGAGAPQPFSLPPLPPPPPPIQPPPRLQPTSSVAAAASSAWQPTDKKAAVSLSLQETLPKPEEERFDTEWDASPQLRPEAAIVPPQPEQPQVWRKGGLQGEAEGRVLEKDVWRGKMAEDGDRWVEEEGVQQKLPVRGRNERWAQRFCRETLGVEIPHGRDAQYRLLCPECMGGSTAEKSLSLSVMADGRLVKWQCFRSKCGWCGSGSSSGAASPARVGRPAGTMHGQRSREEPQLKVDTRKFQPLSQEVLDFFERRDIGADTLKANGVQEVTEYCPATRQQETAIAFLYYRDGRLVNVKYRTLDKHFWQAKGGSQATLYGYDAALAALDEQELRGDRAKLVFVEGEMDKLTLNDQGMWNVVSVPSGAPAKVKEGPVNKHDKKFTYLMDEEQEELHPMLRSVDCFLIATDNDGPGRALATELARRLGKVKCWMVKWPDSWDDHRYLAVHHSSHPNYEAAMQSKICSPTADPAPPDSGAAAPWVEEHLRDAQRDHDARDAEAKSLFGTPSAGNTESGPAEAPHTGEQLAEATGVAAQPPADSVHEQEAPAGGGWEEGALLADCARELMPEGDSGFRKDANEVLMKDGPMALRWFMDNAQPIPVQGLHELVDYYTDVMELYNKSLAVGHSTGWPNLDAHYRVVPGELTLLTGVPNSGKSEFLDALVLNLAMQDGFSFAMASMEKSGAEHIRQLLEKYLGKPFYNKPRYAPGVPRMRLEDVVEGYKFLQEHFFMLEHGDDLVPNVDWIIDRARAAVLRYGIRGLVIDPYNELDHSRTSNKTETEFVSELLSKLKRFASLYEVHVWLVAHPRQMYDWQGEAPNLYSVSGSANFVNKADAGIVVHRNWQKMLGEKKKDRAGRYGRGREEEDVEDKPVDESLVQIRVLKMRNKAAGSVGEAWLRYDIATGRYSAADQAGEAAQPQLPSHGVLARLGNSLSTERTSSASCNQNGGSEPSSETDAAAVVG